jgi:hypothetical protein
MHHLVDKRHVWCVKTCFLYTLAPLRTQASQALRREESARPKPTNINRGDLETLIIRETASKGKTTSGTRGRACILTSLCA